MKIPVNRLTALQNVNANYAFHHAPVFVALKPMNGADEKESMASVS